MMWGWVNHDRFVIFGWTISFSAVGCQTCCQMSGLLTNRNIQTFPIKKKQKEHFCFVKEPPLRLSQKRQLSLWYNWTLGFEICIWPPVNMQEEESDVETKIWWGFLFMTPILSESTDTQCNASPLAHISAGFRGLDVHPQCFTLQTGCLHKQNTAHLVLKWEDSLPVNYLTSNLQ